MKKIITILMLIILSSTAKAENIIDNINKTIDNEAITDTLSHFYPVVSFVFFLPYNKEAYKDKKFTYIISEKRPTSNSTMLGVSLRLNMYCTKTN